MSQPTTICGGDGEQFCWCAPSGPPLGSQWVDAETGETIVVEEFDGAYAVVTGEFHQAGRGSTHSGKPFAFLVQPSHFGRTYLPKE